MTVALGLWVLAAISAQVATGAQVRASQASSANPIRRTVKMLQAMQKKVEEEGEKEEELYDKFDCFCGKSSTGLKDSISEAQSAIPQLESKLEQTVAALSQLKADIKQASSDKGAATEALEQGEALRAEQKSAYLKARADLRSYIAALQKAIKALAEGAGVGFLQTPHAAKLRQLAATADLSDRARMMLNAFLEQGSAEVETVGYTPQSPEVKGMLSQMLDDMTADLQELEEGEAKAVEDFEGMTAAKEKEIVALKEAIEEKTARVGDQGVAVVNIRNDLDETQANLEENEALLKQLQKNCQTKKKEWDIRQETRSAELGAISETIKLLNEDTSLELFKHTLPSLSFLQTDVDASEVQHKALDSLKTRGHGADYRVNLIALALSGKKVSFEKVIKTIDKLLDGLAAEQIADDRKQDMCRTEIAQTEEQLQGLQAKTSDLDKRKQDLDSNLEATAQEMAALEKSIQDLDKEVGEATKQRKEENSLFKEEQSTHMRAVELLNKAMRRLSTFYQPELYDADKSDQAAQAQEAASFTQLRSATRKATPEWGTYKKKDKENTQVLEMLGFLKADLEKELAEMDASEKAAQAEYMDLLTTAASTREQSTKDLTNKSALKAALEQQILHTKRDLKAARAAALATESALQELHATCDWLLQNHEIRKKARAAEVESLQTAKGVLSGSDLSFLQMRLGIGLARRCRGHCLEARWPGGALGD
mmetsp:Transcript_20200/g.46434  ORF Transcript_20200/g.46434 Transcript_20200/m.46434 type:complete len:712 (+) Transcript_20200:75-2210(+)